MAADLDVAPWNRLERLAPTGTAEVDLQEAADRYAAVAATRSTLATYDDLYAAAADLWEEYAMTLETSGSSEITSEQTGDVRVVYAGASGAIASALQRVGYFRMRSNVYTARLAEALHGNEKKYSDEDDSYDGGLIWVS